MVLSAAIGIPIFLLIAFMFLVSGCELGAEKDKRGSLSISFGTFSPRVSLPRGMAQPAKYDIMGIGPDGVGFDISSREPDIVVDDLERGTWTILVSAENSSGTFIGQGEARIRVTGEERESVQIIVNPLDGHGAVAFPVTWDPKEMGTPDFRARLVSSIGDPIDLDFTETGSGAGTVSLATIPAGSYILTVQLSDGGAGMCGAVDTVKIFEGMICTGFIRFTPKGPSGCVGILLDPALDKPLSLSILASREEITRGEAVDLSARVDGADEEVRTAWYLNGAQIREGERLTLDGSDLPPGVYRIDCVASTVDGRRRGSSHVVLHVKDSLAA